MTENPTLSDALKEAYASAPSDKVIINTLSLYFNGLKPDGENEDELYFFSGFQGDYRTDKGVPMLQARLEDTSRFHPGEVIEFMAIPFKIILPDISSEATATGKLKIDGVGRDVTDQLKAAVEVGEAIELTYRQYLSDVKLDGPQNIPVMEFNISNVGATALTVSGSITTTSIGTLRFPKEVYDRDRWPGLAF